jgi:hypothetical protein
MVRKLTIAAALTLAFAAPGEAQIRVGISVFGGGFLPANNLFESVRAGGPDGVIVLNLGLEPGPLFGGRLSVRRARISAELEVGYALTDLGFPALLIERGERENASLVLGSVNVAYDVFQAAFSPLTAHVSAGLGFVARGGDFLRSFESTTDVAGIVGVGIRYGISPAMFLRFDVRDYISSFAPVTRGGFQFPSQAQHDLIGTIGLELSLSPIR